MRTSFIEKLFVRGRYKRSKRRDLCILSPYSYLLHAHCSLSLFEAGLGGEGGWFKGLGVFVRTIAIKEVLIFPPLFSVLIVTVFKIQVRMQFFTVTCRRSQTSFKCRSEGEINSPLNTLAVTVGSLKP